MKKAIGFLKKTIAILLTICMLPVSLVFADDIPTHIVYVTGSQQQNGDGSAASPFNNLDDAYAALPSSGTVSTNIIMVCGNISLANGYTLPAKPATITSRFNGSDYSGSGSFTYSGKLYLSAATSFINVRLLCTTSGTDAIYACGNPVVISSLSTSSCGSVYGGKDAGTCGDTNVTISNGVFTNIYGGSYGSSTVTANTNIVMNGGSAVNIYAGSSGGTVGTTNILFSGGTVNYLVGGGASCTAASANITVTGGTVNNDIYGAFRWGGTVTGATVITLGGNPTIKGTLNGNGGGTVNGTKTLNFSGYTKTAAFNNSLVNFDSVHIGSKDGVASTLTLASALPSNVSLTLDGGNRLTLSSSETIAAFSGSAALPKGSLKLSDGATLSVTGAVSGSTLVTFSAGTAVISVTESSGNSAGIFTCPANAGTVTYNNPKIAGKDTWVFTALAPIPVVYVDGSLSESGDGATASGAVATLSDAYARLPENGTTAGNVIVVCGETTLDSNYSMPAKPATITSRYGTQDYTSTARLTYSGKLYLNAPTILQNVRLACTSASSDAIYARGNALAISCDSSVQAGSVYGGTDSGSCGNTNITIGGGLFTNIFGGSNGASTVTGNTSVSMSGGTAVNIYVGSYGGISGVSNVIFSGGTVNYIVGGSSGGTASGTNLTITGGTVNNNVYGSDRWGGTVTGNTSITVNGGNVKGGIYGSGGGSATDGTVGGNTAILLSGNPVISGALNGSGSGAVAGSKQLVFSGFTGSFTGTITNFDAVDVSAENGSAEASFTSLDAACSAMGTTGGTITLTDPVTVDGAGFSRANSLQITIGGSAPDAVLDFSGVSLFNLNGSVKFQNIGLKFSADADNPTILCYQGGAPDLTDATIDTVNRYYRFIDTTLPSTNPNALNISFGDQLTSQETNGYANLTGYSTVVSRFNQTKQELPDEVPVVQPVTPRGDHVFYVSPGGSDTADGSINAPFQTIQKALASVKNLSASQKTQGALIYLREGTYTCSEAIQINSSNCDLIENVPMFISAYNGENVTITGSQTISGSAFTPVTEQNTGSDMWARMSTQAKSGAYVADLAALGITQYPALTGSKQSGVPILLVNGQRMTLARYPNVGGVTSGAIVSNDPVLQYTLSDTRPLQWLNTGNIWIWGSFYAEWWKQRYNITSINSATNVVTTAQKSGFGAQTLASNKHYYYNVFEELDMPGEWYLDNTTGKLYVYPIGNGAIISASLTTSANSFLLQADGAQNVIINGITFEAANGGISVTNSKQVIIQNSTVQDMGGYGVYIKDSFKCGVTSSTIRRTDYVAFFVDESAASRLQLKPHRNFLQNSYIYDIAVSSAQIQGTGNIVSHNLFQHTASMGLCLTHSNESIVEYNEFTGTSYDQSDAGAVYVSGSADGRGNHIRYNYIHNSSPEGSTNNARGIYFDDMSCGNYAYGNIIDSMQIGMFIHNGDDNVFQDNVILKCSTSIMEQPTYYTSDTSFSSWVIDTGSDYVGFTEHFFNNTQPWSTRYPTLQAYKESIAEVRQLWNAGNRTNPDVLYFRTATGNDISNNTIVNSTAVNMSSYAQPYTTGLSTNTALSSLAITGVSHYADMGIEATAQTNPNLAMGSGLDLILPQNSSQTLSGNKLDLAWQPVNASSYYTIQIATDASFSDVVIEADTSSPQYTASLIGTATDYYWRVTAHSLSKPSSAQTLTSAAGHFVFAETGSVGGGYHLLHGTPVVDGTLDPVYTNSIRVNLGPQCYAIPDSTASYSTTGYGFLVWDENYLYFYADITKNNVLSNPLLQDYKNAGDSRYFTFRRFADCVQAFLKTPNTQQFETTVHALGNAYFSTLSGYDTSNAQYATTVKADGTGYTVEMAIPFPETVSAGDKIQFEMLANSIDDTKYNDYVTLANANGGINGTYNGTDVIRQTPLFQYSDGYLTTYTLSSNT